MPVLVMEPNAIHVWSGRIAAGEDCFLDLYASLSQDEIEKANRLHFEKDRRSYMISRGLLRSILAAYLGLEPSEIEFQYSTHGKPFLRNQAMYFSVSHSGDRVLYAFCKNCDLGVDLEQVRELDDAGIIAQRFFAVSECLELCATRQPTRTRAFFCCWTRKEAYIKAMGQGLSLALDSFQVPMAPAPMGNLRIRIGPDAFCDGNLRHLDPAPGYVGALFTSWPFFSLVDWTFDTAEGCISNLPAQVRANLSS
jgi:4'-phosphopantetheinyl transferase